MSVRVPVEQVGQCIGQSASSAGGRERERTVKVIPWCLWLWNYRLLPSYTESLPFLPSSTLKVFLFFPLLHWKSSSSSPFEIKNSRPTNENLFSKDRILCWQSEPSSFIKTFPANKVTLNSLPLASVNKNNSSKNPAYKASLVLLFRLGREDSLMSRLRTSPSSVCFFFVSLPE